MNRAPLLFAALLSTVALFPGCSDSAAPAVSSSGEAAPAPEEQVAAPPATAGSGLAETEPPPGSGPVAEPAPGSGPGVAVEPPAGAELPPVAAGPSSALPMPRFADEEKAFQDWCLRYGLAANDPAMLDADRDGDGVPNRDEFVGDSDPLDPNSRPGIPAGIRLKSYSEVRLPVMLDQVKGDKAFLKQVEGTESKEEVVKAGDTVRGMKVGRVVTRRETDKTGQPVDVSRVTLEDLTTKERVTLVRGMPARTAATHAVLASPDGRTSITVRQGETFEWPGVGGQPGAHYTVVDMSDDQVVVQQVENQKMWTIPRR